MPTPRNNRGPAARLSPATRARRRQAPRSRPTRSANLAFFIVIVIISVFAFAYSRMGDGMFRADAPLIPGENEIFVYFIDVGQGDSILIQSREHAILIDGGEANQRQTVLSYLRGAGITFLDYVVATHPHSDHIGGLVGVLGQVTVGRVIMPEVTHNTVTFEHFLTAINNHNIPVTFPQVGDRIQAGIIDLTVLAPTPGPHANLNNASIVLRLDHGDMSFLFTGDAEAASEQAMLASGQHLRANVLNIGHHGSRTSTTPAFLDAVNPGAAVISVGRDNRYGHPHPEVLDLLNARGIMILRTDIHGTILMVTDGTDILWFE